MTTSAGCDSARIYRAVCQALVYRMLTASGDAQHTSVKIVIQDVRGAINNTQFSRAKEPAVQGPEESGAPIQQASVTFQLSDTEPGAVFADGNKMLTVQTDEKGQAVGRRLRPNQTPERYQIRVTASDRGATAIAVISEINAEPAATSGPGSKKFLIIALIGGAAAGGLVAARGGSKSSSGGTVGTIRTPPATVLVPATPMVQPPH
jgi:hypothetical protein